MRMIARMFSRTTLVLATVTLAAGATAALAQPAPGAQRPDRTAPITRADAEARAAAMFARMDANKDGKLDQADRAAREGERFARLDTNKDGQLSREEFAAARHQRHGAGEARRGPGAQRGKQHGGMMRGMMGRMADADKDGAISKAEFVAAQTRRFDLADANKDGTITAEERQAVRAKMRERMQEMRAGRGAAGNQPD